MDLQVWRFSLSEGNEKDGPVSLSSQSRTSKHLLMASKTSGKKVTGNQLYLDIYNEILVK